MYAAKTMRRFGTCPYARLSGISGHAPPPEPAKRPTFNTVICGAGVALHTRAKRVHGKTFLDGKPGET